MNYPTEPGGGGRSYSSITPEVMDDLVANVKGAGSTLQTLVSGYKSRAAALDVSSPAFAKLLELGSWADDQVAMLQRRLTLAQALEAPGSDGYTPVTLGEPITMTEAEASAKGRELAAALAAHNRTDEGYVELAEQTMDELKNLYGNDPDVMSAFYGELGPQGTDLLLEMYHASGGKDPAYVQQVGETFAMATQDTEPPQSFLEVKNAFLTPSGDDDYPIGPATWGRLAILQNGNYPPDFLADAVKANGLDYFKEHGYDTDMRSGISSRLGLSEDCVALMFSALRNSPEGARLAIGDADLTEMSKEVYGLAQSLGTGDDIADAFGLAMQAATGANDETMGQHSAEANDFAGRFIYASAQVEEVPWSVKDSLGEIAASYAPELLTGAEGDDAGSRGSSFDKPANFTDIPGVDPGFYLSQKDTYRFLHGFADDDRFSQPFDEAMGELYHTTQVAAAREMATHPESDVWRVVNTRFGQLSGLEYQAQLEVRGDMDEQDKKIRELIGSVVSFGLGKIPTPQGVAAKYAWKLAMYGAGKAVSAFTEGDPEQTRVALRTDAELRAAFMRQYQMASVLHDADYPGLDTLPDSLKDENGNLVDPSTIAQDTNLIAAFQQWSDANDTGNTNGIDAMIDGGRGGFEAGNTTAQNNVTGNPDVDGDGYNW